MKQCWKKLAAAVIALVMVLTMFPVQWASYAQAEGETGTVTANDVFLRKQPGSSSYWFKMPMGHTCTVLGTVTEDGVMWYKVNSTHPDSSTSNTYIGYVHSDFFSVGGDAENSDPDVNDSAPENEETQALVGEVIEKVNFRAEANTDSEVYAELAAGTLVEVLTVPDTMDDAHWCQVAYDGKTGYIVASYLTVSDAEGESGSADDSASGDASTGDSSNDASSSTGATVNNYGYVQLILSSCNLRSAPGGKVLAQWENAGEVIPVTGSAQAQGGYTWYPVLYNGSYYFVRNDCVQYIAATDSSSNGAALSVLGYLKTTKANVNLRLQPGGAFIEQIDKNTVVKRLSDAVSSSGYTWYLIEVNNTRGYMRSDCVSPCTADGTAISDSSSSSGDSSSEGSSGVTTSSYGYVITTKSGVNLRAKPAGTSKEQIDKGVILPMTGYSVVSGKYTWYPVQAASGKTGYVRSDCVTYCTSDGTATTEPEHSGDSSVTVPPSTSSYGYVMIKSSGVNVRKTPGGTSLGQVNKNTVWPMTGYATTSGGYTWYPINANGLKGYVRGDHSFKLSAAQEQSYLAGNGVPDEDTPAETTAQYVQTVLTSVNLRASASKDSTSKFQVDKGTVMAFDASVSVGGSTWYRVIYENTQVWVIDYCVSVMTAAEYEEYLASNPSSTPQTQILRGYIKTTASSVNVRVGAGSSSKLGQIDKGVVMPYSATETAKGYTWYYATTPLGKGYLRADFVSICDENGDAITSGTPSSPTTGQEASYTTLKLGSKGTAVTNLVTELKLQGYYSGEITSSYTSAVESAVKAFQSANNLKVDGIAGSATQHALYGTVPVGSGDSSNLSFTIYPAEKIDWYTGGIQQLWAKGSSYKVYDVKTGLVWWARRWSGAYHADVEPLTAADTATLCKIYGVDDAQDIWDDNLWQRRPCLVTIGSRTFACSLYGMPHNYPDGDTISDNNMKGQICIHFTNSRIHESGTVCSYHTKAIEEAYQYAKDGDPR